MTSHNDPAPEPVEQASWTNVPASELDMASFTGVDNELATSGFGPKRARRVTGSGTGFGIVAGRLLHHPAARLGLIVLISIALLAFTSIGIGPIPGWWKYNYTDFEPALADHGAPTLSVWPPAWGDHPFGQSNEGRDYFALTMRGVQQSLTIAVIVGIVSTVIGAAIGAVSGYFRGTAESVLMRLTDVMITIPLLAVAAVLTRQIGGTGVVGLAVLLGFVTWTSLARIVRGEFLSLRELEFVDAARSVGASNRRIIIRHLLPNAVGVITVSATLTISFTIQLEAALSFLNFGVQSPDISLGTLLEQYRQAMSVRPYLFWWPGIFIIAMSLSINFIGDGLRDAFDPRHSQIGGHRTTTRTIPPPRTTDPQSRPAPTILSVRDLGVDFWVGNSWRMACEHLDFDVFAGEVVALVGESGSGKSTSALSMLDLLPPNSRVAGSVRLRGSELIGARPSVLRQVRGGDIGLIFQDPTAALNPVLTVGFQINEALLSHLDLSPRASRRRVIELMELVGLPDPGRRYNFYPHQLSGGQQQRVMIAMSLACEPVLLVADEPTTALDVTVQAEILDLLKSLRARLGLAILLITHDLGVVADLADRVVVMRAGRIVEIGPSRMLFANPQNVYTRDLIATVPRLEPEPDARQSLPAAGADPASPPAIEVVDLTVEYQGRGRVPTLRAVDQVSFRVSRGEILGLVGESGAGKSTIGRAIVGLLPASSGHIKIAGTDITSQSHRAFKRQCGKVAIVFQDPASALNPRLTIGESVGEPLFLHEHLRRGALAARVEQLLDQVRLGRDYRFRYPHELSGGERQRVGIARALSLWPELLVADEPTSALDVSVQAHILDLIKDLQAQHGFACLFISHDLAVVGNLANQVAVLRRGKLVEIGPRELVLHHPTDPYTKRLLADAPVPDPVEQARRRAALHATRTAHSESTGPEVG